MDSAEKDPRVYFAAERTYLAWIRTGLALMGVGFAVSRFGLFLRELTNVQPHGKLVTTTHSLWSGVALVLLGVVVNVVATIDHFRIVGQLSAGTWKPGHVSRTAVGLGLVLALIGVVMAVYLVLVR